MDDPATEEFLSSIHHALRATRRRHVIRSVHESDAAMLSVRELASQIAAIEHGLPIEQATGEPYRNAYNALSQTHLPTLAETGIIIYDPNRQTVSRGGNLQLAALLVATNRPTVDILSVERSDEG